MRHETYREYVIGGTVSLEDRKFIIEDIYHHYKRSNQIMDEIGIGSSGKLRDELDGESTIYHLMYHFFGKCNSNINVFITWISQTVGIPETNYDRLRGFLELLFSNINAVEMQELKEFCKEKIDGLNVARHNMLWMHLLAQTAASGAGVANPAGAAAAGVANPAGVLENVARLTRIQAPTTTTVDFLQFMNGGDLGKRKSRTKKCKKNKSKKNKRMKM
jgi:hypothetical protein